jgi:hypothetical protein
MIPTQNGKFANTFDDTKRIVLGQGGNRSIFVRAIRKLALQPFGKHFVEKGLGDGFVDHARSGIETGGKPVGANDALAESMDCRCRDFVEMGGRGLQMCEFVSTQGLGDDSGQCWWNSSCAEFGEGPANSRLELARGGFGEGDRGNPGRLDPACDHHRDTGSHQRGLAGAGGRFNQYVGGEIGQRAPPSVQVGHGQGLLQSLARVLLVCANTRCLIRR